jgi:hypothetical protein
MSNLEKPDNNNNQEQKVITSPEQVFRQNKPAEEKNKLLLIKNQTRLLESKSLHKQILNNQPSQNLKMKMYKGIMLKQFLQTIRLYAKLNQLKQAQNRC